jgi:hypothetical protein|tara:strand:+ start:944 stop:1258 length:315 start_codon:yes stop_codon:yes gene_type:complete
MTIAKTITATANVAPKQAILFGVSIATVLPVSPAPPPTGPLVVDIHDSLLTDGSGTLVAKIILPQVQDDSKQVIFPAGVRCGAGISVIITANGHSGASVSLDFS